MSYVVVFMLYMFMIGVTGLCGYWVYVCVRDMKMALYLDRTGEAIFYGFYILVTSGFTGGCVLGIWWVTTHLRIC